MKRYLSFIISICIIFSCLGVSAEELQFDQKVVNPEIPYISGDDFIVENGNAIVEAEDMTLSSDVKMVVDISASGSQAVKVVAAKDKNLTDWKDTDKNSLNVTIKVPELGQYACWLRINAQSGSADSFHWSINGSEWKTRHNDGDYPTDGIYNIVGKGYQWIKLGITPIKDGTFELGLRYREPNLLIDKILLTNDTAIQPSGISGEGEDSKINTEDYWPIPSIKPMEGHPRLFLTPERIEYIKANLDSPEWKTAYNSIYESGTNDLAKQGSGTLMARALLWALGDVDEDHALKTIQFAKNYFGTVTYPNTGDITRVKGDDLVMGAIVYDWCYDLLTESDKRFFINSFKYLASIKESHYPPIGTGHQIGEHDGEGEIFKDLLSAGVAIYDEDPEMYNLAAGRMFDQMIESRNVFHHAGRNYNGTSYGIERTRYESFAPIIFDRMGYEDLFDRDAFGNYREGYGKENMRKLPYTWLYERLPFGLWVKEGNSWLYTNYKYEDGYSSADANMMLNVSSIYDDPYVRGQWVKELALSSYSLQGFWNIVLGKPDQEFRTTADDLPLTRVTTYPMTTVAARTNWQDGLDSPTVVAKMLAFEKITGEHEHMDLGSFSIYYKGTLTMDGGTYNGSTGGWFQSHFMNYMTQSIASNTMNIYVPGEKFDWEIVHTNKEIQANTGGQQPQDYIQTMEEFWATEDLAKTEGVYVGPNETTPEFSYVKTNLTNAYSEKVSNHQRSMVFMNLFDDDYPAAMVVYDNVTSTHPEAKKSFLLQSIEEPTVDGNKSVITRTNDERFTGKLTNVTMLPADTVISKVGGEGMDSWVDGKNYPNDRPEGIDDEQGDWRLEISPAVKSDNDVFLNAMYVSDGADEDLPELPMIKEDFVNFVGATIKDRMVLFSKSGKPISTTSSITVRENGADVMSCLVTDIAEGVWKIEGGSSVIYAEVKAGDNALYFKGKPGEYILSKADGQTITEIEYPETEFAKTGDFLIYKPKQFIYQAKPTKLINDVPYVPVKAILEKLGAEVFWNSADGSISIANNDHLLKMWNGTPEAVYDGHVITLKHIPYTIDGVAYAAAEDLTSVMSCTVRFDDYAKILFITEARNVPALNLDVPADKICSPLSITASGDDGNVPSNVDDGSLATRWSCSGKNGEWLLFDFGDVVEAEDLYIGFAYGDERKTHFAIEVSDDGKSFRTVYDGWSSGDTLELEKFKLPAGTKGRFYRLVGYGNSQNSWNSIAEIVLVKK